MNTFCRRPGCRGIIKRGVCSVCGPVVTTGWLRHNGSPARRGYDKAWIALRKTVIVEATQAAIAAGRGLYPLCA